tara:strand:+ start:664 stop:1488 length:825 start_codon:yes stop_codon:yes gene_type:complete
MNKKNKVIFGQPWGGLGDNLAYSNLPRLYNQDNKKFYISQFNYVRNKEIYDLVWGINPFVIKKIIRLPNIGSNVSLVEDSKIDEQLNIIQNINIKHGFEPGTGYPEIFIDSKNLLSKIEYKNIADFSGFSIFNTVGSSYDLNELKSIQEELLVSNVPFLTYLALNKQSSNNITNTSSDQINIKSINHLIKVLSGTETFYCLNSGSHVLAAYLKYKFGTPKNIISYYPGVDTEKKVVGKYLFDNVNYKNVSIMKNPNAQPTKKIKFYTRLYGYIN